MVKKSNISLKKSGLFDEYARLISIMQKLLDGCVVVLLLIFTASFFGFRFDYYYVYLSVAAFLFTLIVFQVGELYRPWRGVDFLYLVRRLCSAWVVVVALLIGLGFATKTSLIFSRRVISSWMVLVPLALLGLRLMVYMGLQWLRSRGVNNRTVVIAGAGDLGLRLARDIINSPWIGMRLIGFFDDFSTDTAVRLGPGGKGYPNLGNLDKMVDYVRKHKIDMVYLALPMRSEARLRQAVEGLQDTTTSVYFAPDIFIFSLLGASLTSLHGTPLVSLWESPFYGVNAWLKRAEDLLLSGFFFIICLPIMLLIALGIKFSSPGPVFFKQRRYGLDGKKILIYKFRTMKVCEDGAENFTQATRNDPRVTRFGAFLRRTSLDELPQLFNVLEGNMSIVGPRPHPMALNQQFRGLIPGYMLRHKVRPGLTGWAQVNGWRGETETLEKMEKRVEFDLEYLHRWSLWFDLKIVLLTIFRGLTDSHAY